MNAGRLILTLLLMLSATLMGGCADSSTPSANAQDRLHGVADGCNVLLITMDTTRADRLGCYGYELANTPALDALARSGVRFDQAFAQVPITLPSHTALMTGTYPPENGVRDNWRYALGAELPTLAEVFRGHGYRTAAFIASTVLDARYGLARGFDTYDDDMATRHTLEANEVSAKALAWLERAKKGSFFCWIHFFDPHAPYLPSREFLAKSGHPYDGEIAFMDVHIGRLVEWLSANGLRSDTLVVAVGDHGESLGEHGFSWHALLIYDGILRVPLLFSLPGRLPANATHPDLVRVVDVMPTVLDLLGWPIPQETSGQALTSALSGRNTSPRPVYGETDFPYESFGWSKLRCLIDGRWKYIRSPRAELYDRSADPHEERNLAQQRPDVVAEMEQKLVAAEEGMHRRTATPLDIDTETLQAVRALGYVGSLPPVDGPDGDLKNPVDMVDVVEKFRVAESLVHAGQPEQALKLMEPAAQRSPESFAIIELLGKAYAAEGLLELAASRLREALAIQRRSPDTWLLLARVCAARGVLDKAIQACNEALELDPHNGDAEELLPELQQILEQQEKHIAELRVQLQAQPESTEIRLTLAPLLSRTGHADEAIGLLRAGLSKAPQHTLMANELAWMLATTARDDLRNGQEALRWARVACQGASESDPSTLDTLAAALAAAGDFDQAVRTAQRAAQLAASSDQPRALHARILYRLSLYRAHRPYRTP